MSLRIAVVGCGKIAQLYHGPAIAAYAAGHPGCELVACSDVDAGQARSFAARFGFAHACTGLDEVLALRPDAAFLFVPEAFAADLACRIAAASVPLLMEKPPGVSLAEFRRIAAAAASSMVQVAFNRRSMPLVERLRAELTGLEPDHLSCEFVRHDRRDRDFSQTLIHGIDALAHLAGSPWSEASMRYREHPALGAGVADLHVLGGFASGATGSLTCCPVSGAVVERISVHARDHAFFLQLPLWEGADAPGRLVHLHAGRTVLDVAGDAMPGGADPVAAWGFAAEDAAFLDDVRLGRPPGAEVRTAGCAVALAEAIRHRHYAWRS